MSNRLFDFGREGILDESIGMSTGDIRVMLVRSTYSFSNGHKFVADLGIVDNGRSAALSGKTFTAGVFDASDTSLNAVLAVSCNALIFFQHTGSDSTARLIAYVDTPTSGLPVTPAPGQLINIEHFNGANRIFKL